MYIGWLWYSWALPLLIEVRPYTDGRVWTVQIGPVSFVIGQHKIKKT